MKLTSVAFDHQTLIPSKYTCNGENINPPLSIADVPEDARSLVLIMDDPDVPHHLRADGMWNHWIVFNIPVSIVDIEEGSEPEGIHGIGTAENLDYDGPCPPDTEHRYFFRVYALDTILDLIKGVSKKDVVNAMKDHIVDKAELIGLYQKV